MIAARVRIDGAVEDRLEVLRLDWDGRITGMVGGRVELVMPDQGALQPETLAGSFLGLEFVDAERGDTTAMPSAVIQSMEQDYDSAADCEMLRAELRPAMIRMSAEEHCTTFGDATVEAIITEVLERNGFLAGRDFAFRLGDDALRDTPISFVAQFNESDLAFVTRLAEYWGLCMALEPAPNGADIAVFTDDPRALSAIPGKTLPYVGTGYRFGVTLLTRQINVLPRQVVLQNYVHERSEDGLRVAREVTFGSAGQRVEHDHNFRTTDGDGALLARLRADELSCRRMVFRGEAAGAALRAGQLFTITGHPIWGDVKLLAVETHTRYRGTPLMAGADAVPVLTQTFTAVPLAVSDVPLHFRPERVTPKPRIRGVLHGVVEESEDRLNPVIDGDGSYRVRLLAHGSDSGPVQALYPRVRMAQPVGGARSGMHFPLHPGTEVLLSFIDGDPDRPYICGAVPNRRDRSPVTRGTASKNIVQTAAGSRLEFDDGPLAASGARASGDAITGKLHVPWEESRTGSYLRMGRSDDREAAESRGPGAAHARDGWYDFSNGARTSVTMGDTTCIRGGSHREHQHGDHFRTKYGRALRPLGVAGAGGRAGAGSGATERGRAVQAAAAADAGTDAGAETGAATTVEAEYDGILGAHKVTATEANSSAYTRGTDYSFFGGARMSTTAGAYVSHTAGLQYASAIGVKVSFTQAMDLSYTGGRKVSLDKSDSWDVTGDKTISAAGGITLSVRSPATVDAQIKAQETIAKIANYATAAALATEAVASTVLATTAGSDRIASFDEGLAATRGVVSGVSVLSAIATALVLAWRARQAQARKVDVGPTLELGRRRASLMAGASADPGEVAVTGEGALIRSGIMARVEAKGAKAAMESGGPPGAAVGAVSVDRSGVTLRFGVMGIEISAAGVAVSGPLTVNATPLGPAPEDVDPFFYMGMPADHP